MCPAALTVAILLATQTPAPPAAPPPEAQAAWPDDRPFTRLVQNLIADLKALPSIETGLIITAGGAGTAATHPVDDDVSEWAYRQGDAGYTAFGRHFGDAWTQGGLAVGTYITGRVSGDARVTHVGSDLVRAQLLNGVLTRGLKVIVQRERPGGGSRHAFPSGHASATFASAAVIHGHFGWKVGLPAYAMAGFVGWTRVRDNSHWLSDVAMGTAIGIAAGHTVTIGHRDRTWRVIPTRTPGGLAVYVVRSAVR